MTLITISAELLEVQGKGDHSKYKYPLFCFCDFTKEGTKMIERWIKVIRREKKRKMYLKPHQSSVVN